MIRGLSEFNLIAASLFVVPDSSLLRHQGPPRSYLEMNVTSFKSGIGFDETMDPDHNERLGAFRFPLTSFTLPQPNRDPAIPDGPIMTTAA